MANIRETLQAAKSVFRTHGIQDIDAEILMAHILGLSRMQLHDSVLLEQRLAEFENHKDLFEQFSKSCARRLLDEPVQYITGVAPFHNLELSVGPGVLIPRPETELLVESILQHLKNSTAEVSVIDLGSGSGAIAIAIGAELPNARVIAVENDATALVYLQKNIEAHGGSVRIVDGDIASALVGVKADIVVANPPYIPEKTALPPEVEKFEPHAALFGGPTGMEIPSIFIEAGSRLLKSGGLFLIEHGEEQADAVLAALSSDFESIRLHKDYNDRPRWTSATRK